MTKVFDYTVEIVVTKMNDDCHACIKGHPEMWGCGQDESRAIGDSIRSHESEFGIKVLYGGKAFRNDVGIVTCLSCGIRKYVGKFQASDNDMLKHYDKISRCCDKSYYVLVERWNIVMCDRIGRHHMLDRNV